MNHPDTSIHPSDFKRVGARQHGYTALWTLVAVFVLAVAVLLSVARLLFPLVEQRQPYIEQWLSAQIGNPVRFERIEASWKQLEPQLTAYNGRVLDASTGVLLLEFDEVRIGVRWIESFWKGRIRIGSVRMQGARLTLRQARDGRIEVAGLRGDLGTSGGAGVMDWLLSQPRLALRDCSVDWISGSGKVTRFADIQAGLRHPPGGGHVLSGAAALPVKWGERAAFVVEINGDLVRPASWHGRAYVRASGLELPALARAVDLPQIEVRSGRLDIEGWAQWDPQGLHHAAGRLRGRALELARAEQAFQAERAGGTFTWHRTGQGWAMTVTDFSVTRAGHAWPRSTWQVRRTLGAHQVDPVWSGRIGFLDLDDVEATLALFAPDLAQRYAAWQPAGRVQDLVWRHHRGDWWIGARVQDLSAARTADAGPAFAVEGADGWVALGPGGAWLQLDSRDVTVRADAVNDAPMAFERLDGTVRWAHAPAGGWRMLSDELRFVRADGAGVARFDVIGPRDQPALVDVRVHLDRLAFASIPRLLPRAHIPPRALAWLDRAFVAGEVSGDLLWHGSAAGFKRDDGAARLTGRFRARGITLDYAPNWPALHELRADVALDGRTLTVAGDAGRIFDARVRTVHAVIPDLAAAHLLLRGTIDGGLPDGLRYLRESPLVEHLGPLVRALDGSGPTQVRLDLELPIPRGERIVRGEIDLLGNAVTAQRWGLALEAVRGRLHFTGHALDGRDIEAQILGQPARLAVRTLDGDDDGAVEVDVAGRIDAAALDAPGFAGLARRLSGATHYRAVLAFPAGGEQQAPRLTVESDLAGMAVDAPGALAKPAAEARPLQVRTELGGERARTLAFEYGTVLRGEVELPAADDPEPALRAEVEGAELAGRIELPLTDDRTAPVVLDLRRFVLARLPKTTAEAGEGAPPRAFRLDSADTTVHGRALGRVRVQAVPAATGLDVAQIAVDHPLFHAAGSATWRREGGGERSTLSASIDSPDLGAALQHFDYAGHIHNGALHATVEAEWPGPLTQWDARAIEARVQIAIDDGRILGVEPGTGRVFGLLSLHALPRRLSLDFSDVFKKGFSFDHIEGHFTVSEGDAYTNDLTVIGPSARIDVAGRTGLVRRDYDQTVVVTPEMSSTLSIAGGIAGGPAVGAALFLAQKIFEKQLGEMARARYTVTGTWDEPVVERVETEATANPPPRAHEP